MNYDNRTYGLDILRAIAIIIVVIGHGAGISGDLFDAIPNIPLVNGVELFFVLSGFLIGGILIRTVTKSETFTPKDLIHFWKRRWFRTLPNYYLILIVNIVLVYYGITDGDISQFGASFFLFVQNFATGFYGFFWESWSLSIEEWFYLFLPIALFIFLTFLPTKKAIFASILLLLLAPLAYRIAISSEEYDHFWVGIHISKVVVTRLDAIVYGVLGAFIKHYYPNFWKSAKWWALAIALPVIYYHSTFEVEPNDFYFRTFYFSMTSLGILFLFPFFDQIKNFRWKFVGRIVTHISLISYSMYLVHLGIVAMIILKHLPLTDTSDRAFAYILYWSATIVLSSFLYWFFEKPTTKLRDASIFKR